MEEEEFEEATGGGTDLVALFFLANVRAAMMVTAVSYGCRSVSEEFAHLPMPRPLVKLERRIDSTTLDR